MRIVHLSDLHFGKHVSTEKLGILTKDINEWRPELALVSGDVTDNGKKSQFQDALDFLNSLDCQYMVVPGNREICPWAFWEWVFPFAAMSRHRSYFGPEDRIVKVIDSHKIVVFGLNTIHQLPSWPGKLTRETRYWFREESAKYNDMMKILILHHPVFPVVRSSSFWAHFLSDAGDILQTISQNGFSLILQGHKHRSAVMEVNIPQNNSRIVVSCAGAPLMPFWDPSYHRIIASKDVIGVECRVFKNKEFLAAGSYEFTGIGSHDN